MILEPCSSRCFFFFSGAGKGNLTGNAGSNRDAYLQLSVTVLAAFCRVPDIAASQEMVSKIPLVLEISSKQLASYLQNFVDYIAIDYFYIFSNAVDYILLSYFLQILFSFSFFWGETELPLLFLKNVMSFYTWYHLLLKMESGHGMNLGA